jgi:hypothetical protein
MQRRINDPEHIDPELIASAHATGAEVIVQFSKPCYSESMLRQLNPLCEQCSEQLQVRFYGHYGNGFDCRNLRYLPSVRALAVD